jgi:hypothetical protein
MLNWLIGRGQDISILNLLKSPNSKLLAELSAHRLTPLIYQKIADQGLDEDMPQPVYAWLRNDYVLFLKTALVQERQVVQVLRELIQGGVAPILLKGADLRLRLYGNAVVRPMCDLDLLIPPEELPQAKGILEGLSYTRSIDSHCFRPGFRKRFMGELHLTSPDGRLMVDLHWFIEVLANFYRLPYRRLGQMAIPWEYEGMPVKLLCPEHALIHLCLHNYHELRNALQIIDLGLALTRLPIDWPLFLKEAAFFRCQAPLGLMLDGLNQIFPQTVPETVLNSLNDYHPSCLEKLALSPALGKGFSPLARLKHYHRLSDWAAYLSAIFWPHPDYLLAVFGKPDHVTYLRHTFKKYLT